jgi:hypothetical protein
MVSSRPRRDELRSGTGDQSGLHSRIQSPFSSGAGRGSHLVLETTGHVCRDKIRWGIQKWGGTKDQAAVRMVLYKTRT